VSERENGFNVTEFDDGTLRAWLDGDPSLDAATGSRIAAARVNDTALAARLHALSEHADSVTAAFAPFTADEPDIAQVAHAYRIVQTRIAAGQHATWLDTMKERILGMSHLNRTARTRRFVFAGGIAAVALVLVLVLAPVGNVVSAALDVFRYQPTKFAVITVKASDFPQFQNGATGSKPVGTKPSGTAGTADQQQVMQELSKYVKITSSLGQGQMPGREVQTPVEVKTVTGRDAAVASFLPSGVPTTPHYYVSDHQTGDATIDLNAVRPLLQQAGMAGLVPATGNTATIHVDAPAASIVSYGIDPMTQAQQAQGGSAPQQAPKGVVVAAIGTPTIDFQGLDIPGIVQLLSSMNGFPPDLAAKLKSADLAHTLILPVTDDQVVKDGTVNGAPSTLISQKDGSAAVEVFTKNNVMYIVYGSYDAATVDKIAQSVKTS
jgi:hypothetical protein